MKARLGRLEKKARPERPREWAYFRYEDGVYTPNDWQGDNGASMTAEQFAAWRAANPHVGVVIIEEIVGADWRDPAPGVTVKAVNGVSFDVL